MGDLSNTQFFQVEPGPQIYAKDMLDIVYKALKEKGYNPVNQIVGYIMSGDPTYITSHKGARSMIMKVERDELVEELLTEYIKNKSWERYYESTGTGLWLEDCGSCSKRPSWADSPGRGNGMAQAGEQASPYTGTY